MFNETWCGYLFTAGSLCLRFSPISFFMVCADFNVLFLRQFSSDLCNFRFILKRNDFASKLRCQISFIFYSKCIYHFFCTFSGKTEKKQEKCIILMYCLYESINKHNAVVNFFVHALAMFWDQNQKNRSKIDDVIILQNLDSKLKKISITSKILEISKISYKQKCLRICYYTQYWNFRSIEWLVNMSTHEVHAPLKPN